MSGGGDSAGIGTGAATNAALSPNDGMPDKRANGTAGGGATLSGAGAGAQVEQQIVLPEQGPRGPSQPSRPQQSWRAAATA